MIKSHFDHKLLNPVSFAEDQHKHAVETWERLAEELESREKRGYYEWPSERVYVIRENEDEFLDEECPD